MKVEIDVIDTDVHKYNRSKLQKPSHGSDAQIMRADTPVASVSSKQMSQRSFLYELIRKISSHDFKMLVYLRQLYRKMCLIRVCVV